jgi:probable rRNA maturation factor
MDVASLHRLAERVMSGESVAEGTALAILVTDDDEIRAMNLQFLGIDEPTDVLSFPDEADDFVQGLADQKLLGDIAIALPTATRQAREMGHPLDAELAHLLTHGILHLCGYDHVESESDEARMREREEHYLGDLGLIHEHHD